MLGREEDFRHDGDNDFYDLTAFDVSTEEKSTQ